jgi:hypothetical protein
MDLIEYISPYVDKMNQITTVFVYIRYVAPAYRHMHSNVHTFD